MTVEIRRLEPDELRRVVEIDRTERIDTIYVQRGAELEPEDVHMEKRLGS